MIVYDITAPFNIESLERLPQTRSYERSAKRHWNKYDKNSARDCARRIVCRLAKKAQIIDGIVNSFCKFAPTLITSLPQNYFPLTILLLSTSQAIASCYNDSESHQCVPFPYLPSSPVSIFGRARFRARRS